MTSTKFDPENPPPLNGSLSTLYSLIGRPTAELKRPAIMAEAIRELAMIMIHVYTTSQRNMTETSQILGMVKAIADREHKSRMDDKKTEKDTSFDRLVKYFADKVLPSLLTNLLLLAGIALAVFFYERIFNQ